MMTLYCPFCGEPLHGTDQHGQCLGCGAEYALAVKQKCLKQLTVLRCGQMCPCEASDE